MVGAEDGECALFGVATWEPAGARDLPAGKTGLLLRGLYVDPHRQRRGVGSRLLEAAVTGAREQGFDGLLVKAQSDAAGFFLARGLTPLPVTDPERGYPHRFCKATVPRD